MIPRGFWIFALLLASCAHRPPLQSSLPDTALVARVHSLEKQVQSLSEEKLVFEQVIKDKTKDTSSLGEIDKEPELAINGEQSLYSAALEAYWSRNISKLKRLSGMLVKAYPNSVHCDNVVYLYGLALHNDGQYAEALKVFNNLIETYPRSSKVVSSQFQKALIYIRLNLADQSVELFKRIARNYPGSLEAAQSLQQLKLLEPRDKEVSKR